MNASARCHYCHTCGTALKRVLDGEDWCPKCQQYRRYRSHGWTHALADHSPCPTPASEPNPDPMETLNEDYLASQADQDYVNGPDYEPEGDDTAPFPQITGLVPDASTVVPAEAGDIDEVSPGAWRPDPVYGTGYPFLVTW